MTQDTRHKFVHIVCSVSRHFQYAMFIRPFDKQRSKFSSFINYIINYIK